MLGDNSGMWLFLPTHVRTETESEILGTESALENYSIVGIFFTFERPPTMELKLTLCVFQLNAYKLSPVGGQRRFLTLVGSPCGNLSTCGEIVTR